MMTEHEAFTDRLKELVAGDRMERAGDLVRRYWSEPFSGNMFHRLADADHPNEITARDIVAVSTLSVTRPTKISKLLAAKRPPDDELHRRLSNAAKPGAPEDASLLRKLDAMHWMIGKRPNW